MAGKTFKRLRKYDRHLHKRLRRQERELTALVKKVKKLYLHIGALTTTIIADIIQRYLTTK